MEFENLLVAVEAPIATITLNRPQSLNALSTPTLLEIEAAVEGLLEDPQVMVLIIAGAGEKAFSAGGDISVMRDADPMAARNYALLAQRVLNLIEQCPLPVIAAVNGFALGGGCQLAMACDIRIAGETARFGQPEVRLGIMPGFAGTQRLPRLVGKGRAKEMLFTGEMIDAAEACRIGLANRVVPGAELLAEARSMARKIAANGQVAVRLCKEAVNNGMEMPGDKAASYEADLFALCYSTHDQKEGMRAFFEKRPPKFENR